MNIANPYKLFFIVSALAAGFGVRADGTLPIPVASSELPFLMNGEALEETTFGLETVTNAFDISMTLDVADPTILEIDPLLGSRCRPTESFYPASGSVQVAEELFDIQGICAPGAALAGNRQIIATSAGRVLQFDGSFEVDEALAKSFKGDLLTIDSVVTSPETGEVGTKKISFELRQLPVVLD